MKAKAKAQDAKAKAQVKKAAAKAKVAEVKKGGAKTGEKADIEDMVTDMRDNVLMQQQEQEMRIAQMTNKLVYVKRVLMGILTNKSGGSSSGCGSGCSGGNQPKINVSVNGQPINGGAMVGAQADSETKAESNTEAGNSSDAEQDLMDELDFLGEIGVDEVWDV